jgi:hypothetical protein
VDAAAHLCRLTRRRKEMISRDEANPSRGLEPRTPSLPSRFWGAFGSQESAPRAVLPASRPFLVSSSPLPRSSMNDPMEPPTCPQDLTPPSTAGHLLTKERLVQTSDER